MDLFVAGAGTGGTITGTAKRLKEVNPNTFVVGVDPVGSVLARPESLNACTSAVYQVEGIGYDFVSIIDVIVYIFYYSLTKEKKLIYAGS